MIVTAVAANTTWKKKIVAVLSPPSGGNREILAAQEVGAAADELASAAAERERVAAGEEGKHADHCVHHVLGEDVDDVLRPGETRLDEREARLHEEHQRSGDEHPDVVEDGLGVRAFLGQAHRRGEGQDGDDATQP